MNEFTSTDNIVIDDLHNKIEEVQAKPKKAKNYSRIISRCLQIVLVLALWAYFAWATYYFIQNTDDSLDATTCNGYGFLMILFILIHCGIVYKQILALTPFMHPLMVNYFWKPCINLFKKIPYGDKIFYVLVFLGLAVFLGIDTDGDRHRLMPLCGLAIYLIIGFALCSNRKKIPWHTIIWGMILQFVFGLLMIRWKTGRNIFDCMGKKVSTFLNYSVGGSAFVYGDFLVIDKKVFAFQALATIYFLGFMINILYYYGIMQKVVASLGRLLQLIMRTSICESVNSAANIFLGMSEAPLLLKPYLSDLTDSEIHSVMTSGFATVSGTVLAAYISYGADPAHLIIASVMSAPAALCFSKLIYPETEEIIATQDKIETVKVEFDSVLDAASKGAHDASQIVIGIISNVIAFVAFIYFINGVLTWMGILVGFTEPWEQWTVDLILGKVFIPVTFTMGVEWEDCEKVGQLIGLKTMVNEFVAFEKMQNMTLQPKSRIIATYSICGFANPGSIGIMLSALGVLMPQKKEVLTRLVFRAFLGGCFACFMTACVAGLLIADGEKI